MSLEEIPDNLGDYMSSLDSDYYYDVTLVDADGVKHPTFKAIAASLSPVLSNIFLYEPYPAKKEFVLPSLSRKSLSNVVYWFEVGEITLSWSNVQDVLEASEYLDISILSRICQDWLRKKLNVNNVVNLWVYARINFLLDLEKFCFEFHHLKLRQGCSPRRLCWPKC